MDQRFTKILIIRLDEIGDFVLTIPLYRAIRSSFPGAHISTVVNSKVMALAGNCKLVDEVIPFRVMRAPPPLDQLISLVRACSFGRRRLAARGFQCALMPRADIDNAGAAAMAYCSNIPIRIGYSERVLPLKRIKNSGYDSFLTHALPSLVGTHEVEWSLNLGAFVGAEVEGRHLELWPSPASKATVARMLGDGLPGRVIPVSVSPGANIDRRRWPVDRFAELARMLIQQRSARVIVIGGEGDKYLGERIVAEAGCRPGEVLDFTGRLSLDETAALLAQCRLFIGNDSGPMHIAAAMRVPCVEISCHPKDGDKLGANSPARFSPWGVDSIVLQPARPISPCVHSCTRSSAHCIREITVAEAFLAATGLLDATSSQANGTTC